MHATEIRTNTPAPITHRQIHFVSEGDDLARAVAEELVGTLEDAAAIRGVATVALSGGRTAARALEILSGEPYATRADRLWRRVHFFWSEERHVRPDHPESCFRQAHWSLLGRIAVPSVNVHRVRGEMSDAGDAAAAYHQELRSFFVPRHLTRDGLPCFDLAFVCADAADEAVASEARAAEAGRWAVARWSDGAIRYEIGLTLAVIHNARKVLVFLPEGDAAGAGRAASLLRFVA